MVDVCISCKKSISNLAGSTKFKCPNCNDYELVRCKHCRVTATKYRCPSCGFQGPH